jgi:tetratricopeptide (TPR) repeat protein
MADLEDDSGRLEELKLLWESDPTDKVYLQLAEEYRRLGQIQEAIKVLETTLAQRPRDPRGRVVLARCRMDLGAYAEAARTLEEVVKLDPAHAVASKHLLECYLQVRDVEKAAERFNLYRLVNDRDPELDHLEFRLRRLQHGDDDDRKPPAEEMKPVAKETLPMAGPVDPLPFAPFDFSPPPTAPRPAAASRPVFASSADPFGDLLTPLSTPPPAIDLFEALAPKPAAQAPSLDDFWSAFTAPAPAPALDETPIVPWQIAEPMAEAAVDPHLPFPAYEPVPLDPPSSPEVAADDLPAYEPPSYEARTYEPPSYEAPTYEPPVAAQMAEAPVDDVPVDDVPFYAVPAYEPAPEPFFEAPVAEAPADDLEATATLGDLYLLQGHTAEAEEIFRRVLDRDPDNATALAGLRRLRALSQDWFMAPAAPEPAAPVPAAPELEAFVPLADVAAAATESVPPAGGDRRSWAGRTLTAADLLADRSAALERPEGLTAKKILVLKRYLQHLRTARPSYVQ